MRGHNIDKINDIIRMILSKDFETQKLGLSLALEELPSTVLEYETGYIIIDEFLGRSFLNLKEIIKLAIDYKKDDLYFWKYTMIVYSVIKNHNLTTICT